MEAIGRFKRMYLEQKKDRTPEEEEMLKSLTPEPNEHAKEYWKKLNQEPEKKTIRIDVRLFKRKFLLEYKKRFKEYNLKAESQLHVLLNYFAQSENFYKSPLLIKDKSIPGMNKGLLIIGTYGNGKTSTLKTIMEILKPYDPFRWKAFSANEVVEKFEACKNPTDKKAFWNKMLIDRTWFDDVLTEQISSNYGKYDVFKTIIERRYEKKLKTIITMNEDDRFPADPDAAINLLTERYGPRVGDRVYEMFNIIHFKKGSFRK